MSDPPPTLLLSRSVIAGLASTRDYLDAMRAAFLGLAERRYDLAPVGHLPAASGAFHLKCATRLAQPALAVVKVNANFPGNAGARDLPTIQGFIALLDAERGCVLALMDSIEITARRTAATTALAAGHLARPGSRTLALVGCGLQALYHLDALRDVAPLEAVRYCDPRDPAADAFERHARRHGLVAERVLDPGTAARGADIVVTVTTSSRPLLGSADIEPGAFVAGVGADNPAKHELSPELLQASRVVVDSRAQASESGDLAHAIRQGVMGVGEVHAELAEVVSGRVAGRDGEHRRYVFDSTGLAVQDHAAAEMIFDLARRRTDLLALRLDDLVSAPGGG